MEGESRAKYCLERTHIHLDFFEAVRTVPYGRSFMCAAGQCSAHFHLQQKGGWPGHLPCNRWISHELWSETDFSAMFMRQEREMGTAVNCV